MWRPTGVSYELSYVAGYWDISGRRICSVGVWLCVMWSYGEQQSRRGEYRWRRTPLASVRL